MAELRGAMGLQLEGVEDGACATSDMAPCYQNVGLPKHGSLAGCASNGSNRCEDLDKYWKGVVLMESASARFDKKISELTDWRGKTLAKVREIVHGADPEIIEEWKWVSPNRPGTPIFSRAGIVCTGEAYKSVVKTTFAHGAALKDPDGLVQLQPGGQCSPRHRLP